MLIFYVAIFFPTLTFYVNTLAQDYQKYNYVCVYIYLITYNVAVKKIKFEYCGFPPRWLSDNYNFLYSFVLYLLPEPRHIYRLRKPEAWICTAESMNLYLLWQFETLKWKEWYHWVVKLHIITSIVRNKPILHAWDLLNNAWEHIKGVVEMVMLGVTIQIHMNVMNTI